MRSPGLVSWALRLAAMVAAGAAAVLIDTVQTTRPYVPGPQGTATSEPPVSAPLPQPSRSWALRAGGWYIRVDGAEIAIPSVAEQTASRPRASLAFSISPYDQLIVQHAKSEGLDWRLVAAVMFEESRFNPDSRSDKGAYGLMQVRPIAAEAVGSAHFMAPDDNVRTGVRYLHQLDGMFRGAPAHDRLRLVLAAYNVGPGHVGDAQMLARHFGYSPNRWDDAIELMLPLLEQPSIYKKLPNGFAKGGDTVHYVQRIIERYYQYQRDTAGVPTAETLSAPDAAAAQG